MDKSRFCDFDAAEFLDNEETIAAYLSDAISDPNPDIFISALADVARAQSITVLAEKTGLARESIYDTLKPGAKPGYETIAKILSALNVRLQVTPVFDEQITGWAKSRYRV